MEKMRLFLACADDRLRIPLLLFLDDQPGMVVVGITDGLSALPAQLEASQADVLLLEWELPYPLLADLLTKVSQHEPPPEIILFSRKPDDEEAIRAAGADYIITKNAPPDELIPILKNILVQRNLNQPISIST